MNKLDSILKSRDITLPTKVHLVKAMVFPVVMYGCESWTVKKAECRKIDAFELWCWRRLFFFFLENTLESMISLVCEVKKKPQTNKNEPKKQTETQAYSDRKQIGVCQMGGD